MHLEQQADQFHGNVTIPAFSEICEQHVSSICLGAVDDAVADLFHALSERLSFHVAGAAAGERLELGDSRHGLTFGETVALRMMLGRAAQHGGD